MMEVFRIPLPDWIADIVKKRSLETQLSTQYVIQRALAEHLGGEQASIEDIERPSEPGRRSRGRF
jgi:hypothetical protein